MHQEFFEEDELHMRMGADHYLAQELMRVSGSSRSSADDLSVRTAGLRLSSHAGASAWCEAGRACIR